MADMDRRRILQGALGVGVLGTLVGPRAALAGQGNHAYRWDLINVLSGCIEAGGHASSKARDGARITVTGAGGFLGPVAVDALARQGARVQAIIGPPGEPARIPPAGSGTYEVTRFISFDLPPGGNVGGCDNIGELDDRRPGRLTVAIAYDDGSEGVLEVGCRQMGSPASVMEGITATKGYVTFWNHEEPAPGVEGNRTLFHLLR